MLEGSPGAGSGGPRLRSVLDPRRRVGALIIYLAVAGVVSFWRLDAVGFMSMEGMVIDGARQMLDSDEWLVPRVYGEIYTYKPALAYWVASLPLRFGDPPSEWLMRMPFAGAGFAMGLVMLLLIGRVAGSRAGLLSALAAMTTLLFLEKTRRAEFDILLTAALGVAVSAACVNLAARRPRWWLWLVACVALSAGFLAKGIPALMIYGPGLLAAAWLTGRWRGLWGWRHLSASLAFVLLAGGYLLAVYESAGPRAFRQPLLEAQVRGFTWQGGSDLLPAAELNGFVGVEPDRAASRVSAVARTLSKPLRIFMALLPWSLLLLFIIPARRPRGEEAVASRLTLAAGGFLVAGTLAFMAVPTHEMRYYLPLGIPLGILAGVTGDRCLGRDDRRTRLAARTALWAAGCAVPLTIVAALAVFTTPPVPIANRLIVVLVGSAVAAALLGLRRRPAGELVVLGLMMVSLCALAAEYLVWQPYRAGKRVQQAEAETLALHLPANGPVWVPGTVDQVGKHGSLLHYLGRPIRSFVPAKRALSGTVPCLLTAEDLQGLAGIREMEFHEHGRVEHPWWSYRAGSCSAPEKPALWGGG